MKRNKIFRWLYFIILLIPIMFVFLPMINNETIYKTEVKQNVEVIEYGSTSPNILPFLKDISYKNLGELAYWVSFNDLKPYLDFYGFTFNGSDEFYLNCCDFGDDGIYFFGGVLNSVIQNDLTIYGLEVGSTSVDDTFFHLVNEDNDNLYEGITFDITSLSEDNTFLAFIFDGFNYAMASKMYSFYYKDYIITEEIVNTSIWYDFSVKMNDSFSFIGGFTEFVSDNIIDLSSNDYVFFSFTYMTYIFVVSLLWLLFEFLMFIINFTHKYMERFYE